MSMTPPISSPVTEQITSWTQLPRIITITQDQTGTIDRTESNGELRFSQVGAFGNMRVAHLTQWRAADSEIVSLWGPPSTFTTTPSTNKPQLGHLHRVTQLPDGRTYQGIAVFHDAFLGGPSALHCEVVTFDGVTLGQFADASLNKTLGKSMRVWHGRRFTFIGQLCEYICDQQDLRLIEVGDIVKVAGMAVTGLDTPATGAPVTSVVPEEHYFRTSQAGTDGIDGVAGAIVTWVDSTNTAKNIMPYWVRSRVAGNQLLVKQWVIGEREPQTWDNVVTFTHALTPLDDGWSGIWSGHVQSNSSHRVRNLSITRIR